MKSTLLTKSRSMRLLFMVVVIAMSMGVLLWLRMPMYAQEPSIDKTITIVSTSLTSEFPEGFRINVEATGKNEIMSVAVRLRIGQQTRGAYNYLCQGGVPIPADAWRCNDLMKGYSVNGELFWRTNTPAQYIPPGTVITYNFEIKDSKGVVLSTKETEFKYRDVRFEWHDISQGAVTVSYHGPVKTRAEIILDSIIKTLREIGPVLGADIEEPIQVTMYNNTKEMLEALPPKSAAISRELITEGQAFAEVGTLLVLGGGRLAKGTASHEVTHIIVHRASDGTFRRAPPWLQEGLAEYANIEPGFAYDVALDFAMSTDRLLPITHLKSLPGDSEDVIIFYGQARSIVNFMIATYGAGKMADLMAAIKNDTSIPEAIQEIYGVDFVELDNLWRKSIGAPEYVPPETSGVRPTPVPRRAILPYSLTPQADVEVIGDKSDEPTSTVMEDIPLPTTTSVSGDGTLLDSQTAIDKSAAVGGSCLRLNFRSTEAQDVSSLGLLVALFGLRFGKRVRKSPISFSKWLKNRLS